MTRREQRIKKIRARIQLAYDSIDRWMHLKHYTSRKQTKKLAERKIEMYENRRDLWEERLVRAELS